MAKNGQTLPKITDTVNISKSESVASTSPKTTEHCQKLPKMSQNYKNIL